MKNRILMSASCAVLMLMACQPAAMAQAESEDAETARVLEGVLVTATRRTERLSEVPISMSVFGESDIEQSSVRELSELSGYIPNVSISGHNDFRSVITIRGVGSDSRNIGFDSRVGVYVDGVYMGQSPAVNQELLDLERVEVLRGPQGMLFGKNTVAGAISLVTKKPSDEFSGKISASVGNYNHREIQGILNVPLTDTLAAKFAISKTDRDGYVENIVTGNDLNTKDVLAYRAQLRYSPNDQFEVNFAYDGLKADNLILVGEPVTDMLGLMPVQVAPEARRVAFSFDPSEDRTVSGALLDAEYRFDNGFTFKSITGYRDTDAFYRNATDYSPVPVIHVEYGDKFEQFTQELQLISAADQRLSYMAGLYFYKQDANTLRDVIFGESFNDAFVRPVVAPSVAPLLGLDPANLSDADLALISAIVGFGPAGSKVYNQGLVETQSVAAYFNGSYDLSDRWTLGFGARYSVEDKDVNWLLDGRLSGLLNIGSTNYDPATPGVPPTPLVNSRKDTFFSPAISLSYAIHANTNIYTKYSSGYKSGGFNLDYINADELAANSGLEFGKETVDSYELGLKSLLLNGRLMLNLAAFRAEYDDYQVNQFVDIGGGRTSIRITNAAKVVTQGLEADFSAQLTDNIYIQGTVGILNAEYDSFPGGGTAGTDVSGNRLVNAPEFTASLGGTYTREIPALRSSLLARLDLTHTGGQFTTADNIRSTMLPLGASVPFGYKDEMTQLNGRIGLIGNGDRFEAYLWGRNLTDEDATMDDFRDFFGTVVNHPNIGRTYGVELIAKF
ncbi:TonB-dependent receptor [Hyphomonas sp. NPDC076900]|uniref:TonB-dependent receptor n=1 Tax=unclassified Hyphomonas TaxID=2630699 RepID=UPI003D031BA6